MAQRFVTGYWVQSVGVVLKLVQRRAGLRRVRSRRVCSRHTRRSG